MNTFLIALTAVAVLLLAAAPGFIFMKKKMLSENCIPGFSKLLLFLCQPCLCIYTFREATFSTEALVNIGVFTLLVLAIHVLMLGGAFLVLKEKGKQVAYRIMTVGSAFGNCAFFGIPLIEALFPGRKELLIYTCVYAAVMNILGWTVGCGIISRSAEHIKLKKVFLNPAMIGLILAIPFFVFDISLPASLGDMINLVGKMCTPLSMIIMGMRLATMDFRSVFGKKNVYITIALKQILMPLIGLLMIVFLPLGTELKQIFYIILCCPVASIVLNYSEILGEGQKDAAATVLLSTILSILTIPVMVLLLPLLA